MTLATVGKRPSALIPVVMSIVALALVGGSLAVSSAAREADEGAVAHLWQLLVAGQLPVIAFFAFTWLPRAPRPALLVLTVQGIALLAALVPVYFLRL